MNKLKVSICIPTYNQPELVKRCLDSIKKQNYKNFEVVITDDSTNYKIKDLVKNYTNSLNIKYIKNKIRLGSPENWNKSMKISSGEYIKIMHHDDWFINANSLSKFVEILDNNKNIDFAFSSSDAYGENNKFRFAHVPTKNEIKKIKKNKYYLFYRNIIGSPSSTIFRKKINIFFDNATKWVVDIDFYIRALEKNKKFYFHKEPLVCVSDQCLHQITATCKNNKEIEIKEYFYLYKKINKNNYAIIKKIWELIKKYNIKSKNEIKDLTNNKKIPLYLNILIIYNKIIYRKIKHLYKILFNKK